MVRGSEIKRVWVINHRRGSETNVNPVVVGEDTSSFTLDYLLEL